MQPIDIILKKASSRPQTIVFPEGEDARVVEAACLSAAEGFARPVLIGKRSAVEEKARSLGADISATTVIDRLAPGRTDEFAHKYLEIRKKAGKDITFSEAAEAMKNPVYFGAMLVRENEAGGMVAGAANYSSTVMRAAYRVIGMKRGAGLFSSFLIISGYATMHGENGSLVLADPSVNPEPSAEQLAEIALSTASSVETLLGWEPRVAMLSFSTRGSSSHKSIGKIREALSMARESRPGLKIDGEMQADAAISPKTARVKGAGGPVAGKANILVFPCLDAGNISYKLIQYLSGANCYGPILQGFSRPVNDLSRGCTTEDIKGVIAVTSVQASAGR